MTEKALLTEAGEILIDLYKDELRANMKVATAKTIKSLRYEIEITEVRLKVTVFALESLLFIERGRRKGAKRPVKKVGNDWVLLGDLPEWKKAVGFRGTDFMLADAIHRNGIKPTPITKQVSEKLQPKIDALLDRYFTDKLTEELVSRSRSLFLNA